MTDRRYRWQQLADQLRNGIAAGKPAVGELLPSVRVLMREHEVSDNTVTKALDELASEGLVQGEHGVGVRVISQAAAPQRSTEEQLAEALARIEDHEQRLHRLENPPAE